MITPEDKKAAEAYIEQFQLLDVSPVVPQRELLLAAAKARFGISTHDAGPKTGQGRWEALWEGGAKRMFGRKVATAYPQSHFEWMSKYCRLLEEAGLLGYGATEADAVLDVCRKNSLPTTPGL